jgi:hypothetical protein
MMPYDQKLHDELLSVAAAVDRNLKLMRAPLKGDPGEVFGTDAARNLAHKVMSQAFDYYLGKVPLTDEQIATMLPEFRGALKIVEALVAEGAQVPLPIISQLVVNVSRAVRRLANGDRFFWHWH